MSNQDDLSTLKQRAEAAGLTKLTDKHLQQLQRATAARARSKANLTVDLTVADEPAHVFTLVEKG
jgi:hypothetical protein